MALETKGLSKISAKKVIAARKLKVAHPELSMQAIKDKLGLKSRSSWSAVWFVGSRIRQKHARKSRDPTLWGFGVGAQSIARICRAVVLGPLDTAAHPEMQSTHQLQILLIKD